MSLVEKDDMTTLRSASDSYATAQTAKDDVQMKAIAYAINAAANTGETRVEFQEFISEKNWQALEDKGYIIRYIRSEARLKNTVISWDPSKHFESDDPEEASI